MDDDNLMDVNFTDLDLNQEPAEPPLARVGSLLDEMETSRGRIAHRFRQLEAAVNARAVQRQRWRQARPNIEISSFLSETAGESGEGAAIDGSSTLGDVVRCAEKGKCCKRDSSHLVAKALEMDSEVKNADKEGGSFYDCNICLEIATEPVLTICGHLFCWACFYQVSYIDSTDKECPVCKGEVSDNTVIPIYGNGGGDRVYVSESGLKIPRRPKARRVESVRQRRLSQGLSHVPVAEALRRIRINIGALGDHALDQEDRSGARRPDTESTEGQIVGEASGSRRRINQVSRVLSESAASLSSLSSVLSSAERLVVDLQSDMHASFSRNDPRASSVDGGGPPVTLSNDQPPDLTADTHPTSSADVSGPLMRMRTLRSSIARDIIANDILVGHTASPITLRSSIPRDTISNDLHEGPTDSSTHQRRSINMSRILDLNNRDAREARRRRLN